MIRTLLLSKLRKVVSISAIQDHTTLQTSYHFSHTANCCLFVRWETDFYSWKRYYIVTQTTFYRASYYIKCFSTKTTTTLYYYKCTPATGAAILLLLSHCSFSCSSYCSYHHDCIHSTTSITNNYIYMFDYYTTILYLILCLLCVVCALLDTRSKR